MEMQTRLNHRIAILAVLVCPLGCSPTSQEKLSWPFAQRGGEAPAVAAHQHHHHVQAHHHVTSHPAARPSSSILASSEEQHLLSLEAPKARQSLDLADYTVSQPRPNAKAATPPANEYIVREPVPAAKSSERPKGLDSLETVSNSGQAPRRPSTDSDKPVGNREFAHAKDYSWVQGRLEYRHRTHEWRVRYEPLWEEDRYGGFLVLEGGGDAQKAWKEGDWVRLSGTVQDSSSAHGPVYQVDQGDVLPESASVD